MPNFCKVTEPTYFGPDPQEYLLLQDLLHQKTARGQANMAGATPTNAELLALVVTLVEKMSD